MRREKEAIRQAAAEREMEECSFQPHADRCVAVCADRVGAREGSNNDGPRRLNIRFLVFPQRFRGWLRAS